MGRRSPKGWKAGAELWAEDNKKGVDLDNDAMMGVIGASGFNESDLKFDDVVEKFIKQLSEDTFGEFYDVISGEVLDVEFI